MNMITTLILDIEGTLTDSGGAVGKKTTELQERLQALEGNGKTIIMCSGRDFKYIQEFKHTWGLIQKTPVIAEDGCIIFDGEQDYLTFDQLKYDPEVIKKSLLEPKLHSLIELDPAKQIMITMYPKGFLVGVKFTYAQIDEIFNYVKTKVNDFDIALTHSSCSVDILPSGVDKLFGLKELIQHLPTLDPANCLYIGDSKNDMEIGKYIQRVGPFGDAIRVAAILGLKHRSPLPEQP